MIEAGYSDDNSKACEEERFREGLLKPDRLKKETEGRELG